MAEQDNSKFRESVLQQLRETLNQRRKLEESGGARENETDNSLKEVDALDPERKRLNNKDFEAEINLKKSYGKWFLVILALQLLIMNGVFIGVGGGWLKFDEPLTLQLYMGGTMTEVFGLVLVVTRYLFKRRLSEDKVCSKQPDDGIRYHNRSGCGPCCRRVLKSDS